MKIKRILSLFVTLALLAGLFVPPAFADSGQTNPDLQKYLTAMIQSSSVTINGATMWAHFDRGQLIYGFPSDVTVSTQGYAQGWKPATESQDWETANAADASQVLSSYTDSTNWQNGIQSGLQNSGGHPGQEPRYLGRNASKEPVSNINFPIDTSTISAPAQCVMIVKPWKSVSADPDYGDRTGGWPTDLSTIDQYHWGVIYGAITDCYKEFGFTSPTDGFLYNPAFSDANGDLGTNNIMNYFEMLVMPEPGSPGTVRFWHNDSDGSGPYYRDIEITWPNGELPDYSVSNFTPFTSTQNTTTVNGQTAAVYNTSSAQYTYTGSVTFEMTGDPANSTNSDEATQQLLKLMDLNTGLAPYSGEDPYYAPIAICVNKTDIYAPVPTTGTTPYQPVPASENCGGTNEGIILGDSNLQMTPGQSYTVNFTWSLPQGFTETSMPIGAGINDGFNDYLNQTTDIIPDDITQCYADLYEVDLSDNFTSVNVPVSGATGSGQNGGNQAEGSLLVEPPSDTINVGGTEPYIALYYPLNGMPVNATNSSTWSCDNASIATIGTNSGVATGVAAGNTGVSATYIPQGGSALTARATLMVLAPPQPPGNNSGYAATLSFAAVNQPDAQTIMGQQIGGSLQRGPDIALWTDTVTATLDASQQPDVSSFVPSGGTVTGVTWSISNASLTYPAINPNFSYGNPVEPTTTTSTSMTSSGHQATTSFVENWSEDGIGYSGSTNVFGVMDNLAGSPYCGQVMAATPKSYQLSAAYTLSGTVSGYIPQPPILTVTGWIYPPPIPFSNPFTIQDSATGTLWVCGAGATPIGGTGARRVIIGSTLNPQTHP